MASHLGHHIEVGVIEHHRLRYARRATGEDEKGERGLVQPSRLIPPRGVLVEIADRECRDAALCDRVVFHHQKACTRRVQLPNDLDVGQARIDRSHSGAQPPRREHQNHELNPVVQLQGHDISGADTQFAKVASGCSHTVQQRGVGQRLDRV